MNPSQNNQAPPDKTQQQNSHITNPNPLNPPLNPTNVEPTITPAEKLPVRRYLIGLGFLIILFLLTVLKMHTNHISGTSNVKGISWEHAFLYSGLIFIGVIILAVIFIFRLKSQKKKAQ